MNRIVSSLVGLIVLTGCRGDAEQAEPHPPAPLISTPYAKDIEALCDSVARSGADKIETDAKQVTVALWLGANIQTAEGRAFLARIGPLAGNAKADALVGEARRVGLEGCSLEAEWRVPE